MNTKKLRGYTKTVATIVTGYGVFELMGSILKEFRPDAKGVRNIAIKIGAAALARMVVDATTDFIANEVDDIFDTVDKVTEKVKNEKAKTVTKEVEADET